MVNYKRKLDNPRGLKPTLIDIFKGFDRRLKVLEAQSKVLTVSIGGVSDGESYTNSIFTVSVVDAYNKSVDSLEFSCVVGDETFTISVVNGECTVNLADELDSVPTGEVEVNLSFEGNTSYDAVSVSQSLNISEILDPTLNIELTSIDVAQDNYTLTVEGVVTDERNSPVSDATITWDLSGSEIPVNMNNDMSLDTGADGTFTLSLSGVGGTYVSGTSVTVHGAKTDYPSVDKVLPAFVKGSVSIDSAEFTNVSSSSGFTLSGTLNFNPMYTTKYVIPDIQFKINNTKWSIDKNSFDDEGNFTYTYNYALSSGTRTVELTLDQNNSTANMFYVVDDSGYTLDFVVE